MHHQYLQHAIVIKRETMHGKINKKVMYINKIEFSTKHTSMMQYKIQRHHST